MICDVGCVKDSQPLFLFQYVKFIFAVVNKKRMICIHKDVYWFTISFVH